MTTPVGEPTMLALRERRVYDIVALRWPDKAKPGDVLALREALDELGV